MTQGAMFNNDLKLSNKFKQAFDQFYASDYFKEKYLLPLYKKDIGLKVKEILRSDDLRFQCGIQCDAVLILNNGNRLLFDDKVRRFKYNSYKNWFIETVSVSSKGAKNKDGWAYKEGVNICFAQLNESENAFLGTPFCFKVDKKFIDEITRNNEFMVSTVKNEGYYTVGKLVPRNTLEKYW